MVQDISDNLSDNQLFQDNKKLIVTQLVKKILLSLWNPKVHYIFTKSRHWPLS
jgi:hypothetical protein